MKHNRSKEKRLHDAMAEQSVIANPAWGPLCDPWKMFDEHPKIAYSRHIVPRKVRDTMPFVSSLKDSIQHNFEFPLFWGPGPGFPVGVPRRIQ